MSSPSLTSCLMIRTCSWVSWSLSVADLQVRSIKNRSCKFATGQSFKRGGDGEGNSCFKFKSPYTVSILSLFFEVSVINQKYHERGVSWWQHVETIVGSLLCCGEGIFLRLFNLLYYPGIIDCLSMQVTTFSCSWQLLHLSQTCKFWSSKANWQLCFLLPSIILTDLLGNKTLL